MGSVTNGNIPDLPPSGNGGDRGSSNGERGPDWQAREIQAHIAAASLTNQGMLEREAQLAADFRKIEEQNQTFIEEMRRNNLAEEQIRQKELKRDEVVSLRQNSAGDAIYIGIGDKRSGLTHIIAGGHYDRLSKHLGVTGGALIDKIMEQAALHPAGVTGGQRPIDGSSEGYMFRTVVSHDGNGWVHDAFIGKPNGQGYLDL